VKLEPPRIRGWLSIDIAIIPILYGILNTKASRRTDGGSISRTTLVQYKSIVILRASQWGGGCLFRERVNPILLTRRAIAKGAQTAGAAGLRCLCANGIHKNFLLFNMY